MNAERSTPKRFLTLDFWDLLTVSVGFAIGVALGVFWL